MTNIGEAYEYKDRRNLYLLGRLIGTYTGWDKSNTWIIAFDDYQPLPGINIPACKFLNVDFENGLLVIHNDNGEEFSVDLIEALEKLPKVNEKIVLKS